ncbi:MAG: sugar ABC transporter permease [Clostridium sp.]|jgi:multiple sugar transport system permease protein/alpha-1,4-digalacturonate transport system permease protein|nr:sugar ABC transporter permease [Clostridium sp.]
MKESALKRPLKKKMNAMEKREAISGYLFLLPNLIGFLVFIAVPVVLGLGVSFTDYTGFPNFDFVFLENYLKMFRDSQFRAALFNNIFYALTSVPLSLLAGLLLALMLNRRRFLGGFFKTVYFFPNLTSMVAIGCVAMLLFDPAQGPVNRLLLFLGVPKERLPGWFASTKTAMLTVVLTVVWKQAGYYMVMFLGGLKTIPEHLYDAARIDGAGTWKCFWNVTWPMLSPTTFMVTILCFIASFQVFDIISITTDGGPGRATMVLVQRIYREAFRNFKMGYASAIAYFLFLIILAVTLIQWRGQKRWVNE